MLKRCLWTRCWEIGEGWGSSKKQHRGTQGTQPALAHQHCDCSLAPPKASQAAENKEDSVSLCMSPKQPLSFKLREKSTHFASYIFMRLPFTTQISQDTAEWFQESLQIVSLQYPSLRHNPVACSEVVVTGGAVHRPDSCSLLC